MIRTYDWRDMIPTEATAKAVNEYFNRVFPEVTPPTELVPTRLLTPEDKTDCVTDDYEGF